MYIERLCCAEFIDAEKGGLFEWCLGWCTCDYDGFRVLHDIKYCPFCGAKLTQDPHGDKEVG